MEVALRRRLEGVAEISISQSEQTAEVRFASSDRLFPADAFREAVWEANVVVVQFQVDVCGSVERDGEQQWFIAGQNRWRLSGSRTVQPNALLCVSGRLDDRAQPPTLDIIDVRTASE
jgi:hypothetical protein